MDKQRQQYLQKWLNKQQNTVKKWIYLNILFGFICGLLIIIQMGILAHILHNIIKIQQLPESFYLLLITLLLCFIGRAILVWIRQKIGFQAGLQLRQHLRKQIIDKLNAVGPMTISQKPAGSWAILMLEQVENLHNFYARYLPQQKIAMLIPIAILGVVFSLNWAAGIILFVTLPLLPLFMILAGMKAAEVNQRHISILSLLSGQFLDKLKGLETIRLFGQAEQQTNQIYQSTEDFRVSTMDVLKMAFLSSAVLEFFTAISIAVTAVYFGFTYLDQIDFGGYNTEVSLFIGFFCLMLAPEFYQPLRELGTYYHDKSTAIGAADSIETFLNTEVSTQQYGSQLLEKDELQISVKDCIVLSPQGTPLSKPLNFDIMPQQHIAIVGQSGAGKTSLINMFLGFLPYQGSVKINGIELKELDITQWRKKLAWVGQNPQLIKGSLKENILLGSPNTTEEELNNALRLSNADEFVNTLGLDYQIQDHSIGLSGGQAQRIAIARAILRPATLLLLDEPTASLDGKSEQQVLQALKTLSEKQATLMITHRVEDLKQSHNILVMKNGEIVQQGSFNHIKNQGYFSQLIDSQIIDKEIP
ncbi:MULTISPECIES: heme ABC transporter permease/ATP-binding protein CydD [Pasteurellaceae]|uniref:Cysteine/glutathione ABC transporter permease/ATP-binding protein CydD n=1 Tax=Pasteurella atlantica TaxID=2827233 RepID=A0AAW8CMZ5_9PAST|nr:cysteine/glutathione ABC transporter permease/ATP-binding protein CydD [Pasteurella atlantica]MBR0572869.1 cysteine/glutathione ABC transporter permease/ATP-binding protein CydD [Pasteurella atlantica]MDP8038797.1 cysteine/glutathione ABC transporter permease/ATP-binding protein CydD [Pasteurella atlantica]MDP8040888.1 cysteine/glutathione ABC transporter permease/ATP-binding protein CydD [Pasteurella atlantica]MDP8042938.1 cysteine/glutathione ABC transporter permease/ATP-binding protein Cy